jgi:hypothetical protein
MRLCVAAFFIWWMGVLGVAIVLSAWRRRGGGEDSS